MIISHEGRSYRLPDFLIPGAARSGTTALFEHLRRHPDIFMPLEKEPMFLALWGIGKRKEWQSGELVEDWTIPELDDYAALFDAASEHQLCGEASVWYLYDTQTVIHNIRKLYGDRAVDLKIVLILRNPVNRAWSHYMTKKSRMKEDLSFAEAIRPETIRERLSQGLCYSYNYLGFGLYSRQVKAWLAAFPHTRVWIHEEFFSDLTTSMKELADFLEISMNDALTIRKHVNPSGMHTNRWTRWIADQLLRPSLGKSLFKRLLPREFRYRLKMGALQRTLKQQPMPDEIRHQLRAYYRDDVDQLETVLNRSLDIWRDSDCPKTGPE